MDNDFGYRVKVQLSIYSGHGGGLLYKGEMIQRILSGSKVSISSTPEMEPTGSNIITDSLFLVITTGILLWPMILNHLRPGLSESFLKVGMVGSPFD